MDLIERKVYLEEADRPPPSYYVDSLKTLPLKKMPFQTPEPEQWMKAPEFVPRFKTIASDSCHRNSRSGGFHEVSVNDVTFSPMEPGSQVIFPNCVNQPVLLGSQFNPHIISPIPMMPITASVNSSGALTFVSNINQASDNSMAPIFLRKKKRNRGKTQSMEIPNSVCRQYTNDQLIDDYHDKCIDKDKIVTIAENGKSEYMASKAGTIDSSRASSNDIVSNNFLDSFDQVFDGNSNVTNEVGAGNEKPSSTMLDTLFVNSSYDSTDRNEMNNLVFRPDDKKHNYPQFENSCIQLATYRNSGIYSHIANKNMFSDSDSDRYEEDCFEGMNITVNALNAFDDFTLSNAHDSTPARFEVIQQVLNSKNRYSTDLKPPDRVCCSVM